MIIRGSFMVIRVKNMKQGACLSTCNYHIMTHEFHMNLFYHDLAASIDVDSLGRWHARKNSNIFVSFLAFSYLCSQKPNMLGL